MVSSYDRTALQAARRRIVLKALAAASPREERDDEDEGPRTLRSENVAAVLAAMNQESVESGER